MFAACIAVAAVLFLFISANRDYSGRLGELLIGITVALAMESPVRFGRQVLSPTVPAQELRRRSEQAFCSTRSLAPGTGRRDCWRNWKTWSESSLGRYGSCVFLRRRLRRSFLRGSPGLAFHLFLLHSVGQSRRADLLWPLSGASPGAGLACHTALAVPGIVSVQTERLRDISLGFDKDLSNAVLWTEKHAEGEKIFLLKMAKACWRSTFRFSIESRMSSLT